MVAFISTRSESPACRTAGMDIYDPYPPRKHLWAGRLKQARHRYVSRPRVASCSCPGSDEEHQGCSVHRRQTGHDDTKLLGGRQRSARVIQVLSPTSKELILDFLRLPAAWRNQVYKGYKLVERETSGPFERTRINLQLRSE